MILQDISSLQQKELKIMANALRVLSVDMIHHSSSGHPGFPLGFADILTVLFRYFIKGNHHHPGRDRFILSAGHGCALLYSLYHLLGLPDYSLDELKKFRQLESFTPGHPEFGFPAIEATTGPLGQGLANAVGIALGQKKIQHFFPDLDLHHKVYVAVGDGCLMEGLSQEALSLAAHWGLNNLVVLWDNNNITIDGETSLSGGDGTQSALRRFQAASWCVREVQGHDYDDIIEALRWAQYQDHPVFLACKTKIGYGSPREGHCSAHGSPLKEDEIFHLKTNLGEKNFPFMISDQAKDLWRKVAMRHHKETLQWHRKFSSHGSYNLLLQHKRHFSLETLGAIFSSLGQEEKEKLLSKAQSTRKVSGVVVKLLQKAQKVQREAFQAYRQHYQSSLATQEDFSEQYPKGEEEEDVLWDYYRSLLDTSLSCPKVYEGQPSWRTYLKQDVPQKTSEEDIEKETLGVKEEENILDTPTSSQQLEERAQEDVLPQDSKQELDHKNNDSQKPPSQDALDSPPSLSKTSSWEERFLDYCPLVFGSADLGESTQIMPLDQGDVFSKTNIGGHYLHYGVREHAMAAIANGLSYHGFYSPVVSTFFTFSDYLRPALRLSCLTKEKVIYIMTHDSIALGEDGPTHQPMEHLSSFRGMPHLCLMRPANTEEVFRAWAKALTYNGPSMIVLSRQDIPLFSTRPMVPLEDLSLEEESLDFPYFSGKHQVSPEGDNDREFSSHDCHHGGQPKGQRAFYDPWRGLALCYVTGHPPHFSKETEEAYIHRVITPKTVVFFSSGSEVSLCWKAIHLLEQQGYHCALISCFSWFLFYEQPLGYQHCFYNLPGQKIVVEAGSSLGWSDLVGPHSLFVTLNTFGGSAPKDKILGYFGFHENNIVEKVVKYYRPF